jgi:hypothetical protein
MTQILGEPLPPEAAIRTAYRGSPRIFVPTKPTQVKVGERQEIRAFVLSSTRCTGVNLYWRPIGERRFTTTAAVCQARQAYRAELAARAQGTMEYYLEASLDNGQEVVWPATAPGINQTVVIW